MAIAKHHTYDLLIESLVLLHAEVLLGSGDTCDHDVNDDSLASEDGENSLPLST